MVHEMLQRRIGFTAVILMPISDRNQKGTWQSELCTAIGVLNQELRILCKDRLGNRHTADHDVGVLDLPLVLIPPALFEAADTTKEFADVMRSPPLTVADHIQSRLLL